MATGSSSPDGVVSRSDRNLILIEYGSTVPTDATAGYEIGALFIHTDGGAGTALYCNEGTAGSCDFDAVTVG